jgi:hypothetical protein
VAYVRQKVIRRGEREYRYYQLVEGYRDPETGKVRQRVLKHLGRFDSIEEARASLGPGQSSD